MRLRLDIDAAVIDIGRDGRVVQPEETQPVGHETVCSAGRTPRKVALAAVWGAVVVAILRADRVPVATARVGNRTAVPVE